jgi:RNA polymerase sigma-B factor
VNDRTALDEPVLTAGTGARGDLAKVSRAERSRRTAELLAEAAAADDEDERAARLDEVIVLNCRVADAVAARYRDRGVPLEDLRQAAYEGLVKAVRRYDPAQAEDLLTFAVPTIRGEVLRHFRDRSWMVRPPRRVQELQTRADNVVSELRGRLGREPTEAEVACDLGVSEAEYVEAIAAFGCFRPPSLERLVAYDPGVAASGHLLVDAHAEHDVIEARCVLEPALSGLSARDQRLLYLAFFEERSQRDIGFELGLTKSQVSRQMQRVLHDLRHAIAPDEDRVPA